MLPSNLLNRYLEPLLRGERKKCREIVHEALSGGAPPRVLIQHLIWPAMERVDRLYRDDRINAVNEHMATRINRVIADQIQTHLPQAPHNGRRVLICCAHDEPEELGAQMCADLFESDGWEVYFAGGGLPHDEIVALVGQLRPALLLLFGSKPSDAPRARELVLTIREINANPGMNIMVSGGVFNRADGLWQEVQADLFAPTVHEALQLANEAQPRAGTAPPLLEHAGSA
jgi:methanogenic corrinoid protein MtbC1